jgi:hypothetical protein
MSNTVYPGFGYQRPMLVSATDPATGDPSIPDGTIWADTRCLPDTMVLWLRESSAWVLANTPILISATDPVTTYGASAIPTGMVWVQDITTFRDQIYRRTSAPAWVSVGFGDILRLDTSVAAAPLTLQGQLRFDTTHRAPIYFDGTSEQIAPTLGHGAYAFPQGTGPMSAFGGTYTLPAAGGMVAFPLVVLSPMNVDRFSFYTTDADGIARTLDVKFYIDRLGTANSLPEWSTGLACAPSYTPGAAGTINTNITTQGTKIYPGVYWVGIRNTTAATAVTIAVEAAGLLAKNACQTKTKTTALGTSLNVVTSSDGGAWVKRDWQPAAWLEGRIAGLSTPF